LRQALVAGESLSHLCAGHGSNRMFEIRNADHGLLSVYNQEWRKGAAPKDGKTPLWRSKNRRSVGSPV